MGPRSKPRYRPRIQVLGSLLDCMKGMPDEVWAKLTAEGDKTWCITRGDSRADPEVLRYGNIDKTGREALIDAWHAETVARRHSAV